MYCEEATFLSPKDWEVLCFQKRVCCAWKRRDLYLSQRQSGSLHSLEYCCSQHGMLAESRNESELVPLVLDGECWRSGLPLDDARAQYCFRMPGHSNFLHHYLPCRDVVHFLDLVLVELEMDAAEADPASLDEALVHARRLRSSTRLLLLRRLEPRSN